MNRALLITYDLNKPGQDYTKLYKSIKALGGWWHHLDSTWIVATPLSPAEAWEKLKGSFDASDHCLIIDVSGDGYSGWLPKKAWDWIKQHVDQPARRW